MNRRAFLTNLFKLGTGAGAVAVYPAATLGILERLFWRKKTTIVVPKLHDNLRIGVYEIVTLGGDDVNVTGLTDYGSVTIPMRFKDAMDLTLIGWSQRKYGFLWRCTHGMEIYKTLPFGHKLLWHDAEQAESGWTIS